EALTIIENNAKVRTCRNKFQVSSSVGSSTQIDAITALTKQVKAFISSMKEAYNRNQDAAFQLMQNQMGHMEETFQERPSCVSPTDTETYPREERKAVTTMDGLTLDGSFIPHSNFLFYQEKEQEPETITKVVKIASSKITPLVPPPKTPPLSTPKPKENLEPNPHQLLIQEEKFQALENPTGRAYHFVYRIDIETFSFDTEEKSSGSTTTHSDYSFPDYDAFYFDDDHIEEKSSDSTTTHSDYSPPDYEAFYFDDDRIEEKSSGSTTTHSDFSLPKYDSFIFDLSIDPFPPADRSISHHEEFADELAHIISLPEYDRFYFDLEIVPGDFTRVLKDNIFDLLTKGLKINELNDSSLLLSDCDSSLSTVLSKIVPLVSFPSGNKDIVFHPRIFIIKRVQSKRFHIFPLDDFPTISFISDSLLLTDPFEID
ncbi:hypothetical protein Tco_1551002, partial [Tanacetum coccineum]